MKCIRTSFGLIDDIIVFLVQYLLVATPINPKLLRKTKPFFKFNSPQYDFDLQLHFISYMSHCSVRIWKLMKIITTSSVAAKKSVA